MHSIYILYEEMEISNELSTNINWRTGYRRAARAHITRRHYL